MTKFAAHLLIVDDDERIRTLLQTFLIRQDFIVSTARDASHAEEGHQHRRARYDDEAGVGAFT